MEIVTAAAFLSSGTLATLTGLKKYDDLDKVQAAFTKFCAERTGTLATWAQAWEAFKIAGFPGWNQKPVGASERI